MVFEEFPSYDLISCEFTYDFQCSLPSVLCEFLSKTEQNGATKKTELYKNEEAGKLSQTWA